YDLPSSHEAGKLVRLRQEADASIPDRSPVCLRPPRLGCLVPTDGRQRCRGARDLWRHLRRVTWSAAPSEPRGCSYPPRSSRTDGVAADRSNAAVRRTRLAVVGPGGRMAQGRSRWIGAVRRAKVSRKPGVISLDHLEYVARRKRCRGWRHPAGEILRGRPCHNTEGGEAGF